MAEHAPGQPNLSVPSQEEIARVYEEFQYQFQQCKNTNEGESTQEARQRDCGPASVLFQQYVSMKHAAGESLDEEYVRSVMKELDLSIPSSGQARKVASLMERAEQKCRNEKEANQSGWRDTCQIAQQRRAEWVDTMQRQGYCMKDNRTGKYIVPPPPNNPYIACGSIG